MLRRNHPVASFSPRPWPRDGRLCGKARSIGPTKWFVCRLFCPGPTQGFPVTKSAPLPPYTSIGTNLLFFTKGTPTKEIWYYEHP
jgi:hypothetical protein